MEEMVQDNGILSSSEVLIRKIERCIMKDPFEQSYYCDMFDAIRNFGDLNKKASYGHNRHFRFLCVKAIKNSTDYRFKEALYDLQKKSYLYSSTECFEDFLIYLEWNRKPEERFYLPRRKTLKVLTVALQDIYDGILDELIISLPPRIGKTTLLMFYTSWIIGKLPERTNLYSAYSDSITSSFYKGVLEVIQDPVTYLWHDVFPESKIASTDASEEKLNINRDKRYATLTCRSLYGTLNGSCDCDSMLIADDLLSGIEEALNKDRLITAWGKVDNNLIPRAKEGAKIIWCGTRWSMIDPIGLRMSLLEEDDEYKNRKVRIINIPALDENDESNFNYEYGVGFSTSYYHQRRASFERNNDMASWCAQYQGIPIEREGALFAPSEMQYFNGVLPEGEPDRIFMAVDVAWGGDDYVSAPIVYQYDDALYCLDVVFNAGDKYVTRPEVVRRTKLHGIQAALFEANNGGEEYREWVETELKKDEYRLNITSRVSPSNKRKCERILDKAPEIREIYFLESGKRNKEYSLFMQNLLSYKIIGKNKHDDAPDSLALLMEMKRKKSREVKTFKRVF